MIFERNPGDDDPAVDNVTVHLKAPHNVILVNGFELPGCGYSRGREGEPFAHWLVVHSVCFGFHDLDDFHSACRAMAKAIAVERGYARWPRHPEDHHSVKTPPFGPSVRQVSGLEE